MVYIITIFFILVFLLGIIINIWATKKNCNEQSKNTTVIYCLYKELERYNNNLKNKGSN